MLMLNWKSSLSCKLKKRKNLKTCQLFSFRPYNMHISFLIN